MGIIQRLGIVFEERCQFCLERLGRVRADQATRSGFTQTFQVAGSYRNKQIDRS